MKSFLLGLSVFVAFGSFAQAAPAIVCRGESQKGKPVVLTIEKTGKQSTSGFQLVDLKKVVLGASNPVDKNQMLTKPVDGCMGAFLAGEFNGQLTKNYTGDLYLECAGDGDAGYMNLKKKSSKRFVGTFVAPNGKASLGLADEESISLNCVLK